MTASTAITPFNFNEHAVRVIQIEDAPWFVATDVAESLGYKSPKDAASYLDDDEKGSAIVRTPGGDQKLTVINESGLYALVLRSRKPEARKFAKWVTSEVLPAIRKTGKYERPTTPYTVQPSDTLNESQQIALRAMLESNVKRLPHEKQAGAMIKGWSKLKAHFGVPYRQIPASEFTEALSIIARHVSEWELVEDAAKQPDAAPKLNAFMQALAAARENAMSYLNGFRKAVQAGQLGPRIDDIPSALLEGIVADALINSRFLAGFDQRTGKMHVQLVPHDASVFSFQSGDFGQAISAIPTRRLPELQDALSKRVARHLGSLGH